MGLRGNNQTTYEEAVNNIGGNMEHMAVEKETIIEKRIIWTFSKGVNPCTAVFRDGKFADLMVGYNDHSITTQMMQADPDGFVEFADEVRKALTIKEVRDRITGK
jgi:hypothetical protein